MREVLSVGALTSRIAGFADPMEASSGERPGENAQGFARTPCDTPRSVSLALQLRNGCVSRPDVLDSDGALPSTTLQPLPHFLRFPACGSEENKARTGVNVLEGGGSLLLIAGGGECALRISDL